MIPAALNNVMLDVPAAAPVEQGNVSDGLMRLPRYALWPWLAAAALDWGTIIAVAVAARTLDWWPLWLVAAWIIGNRQHALAVLGHDGAHQTLTRHRWLNDLLTTALAFWPLGLPLGPYRKFHFSHHRNLGTPQDPELLHKHWASPAMDLPLRPWRLVAYTVRDLLGGGLRDVVLLVVLVRRGTPLSVGLLPGILQISSAALLIWLGAAWIPLLWLGGLMTGFWASFRWRVFLEHAGTDGSLRVAQPWWMRLLFAPHGTGHHWEHHQQPSLPFSVLPRMRLLGGGQPVLSIPAWWRFLIHSPPWRY